jgi:hypothetical protein
MRNLCFSCDAFDSYLNYRDFKGIGFDSKFQLKPNIRENFYFFFLMKMNFMNIFLIISQLLLFSCCQPIVPKDSKDLIVRRVILYWPEEIPNNAVKGEPKNVVNFENSSQTSQMNNNFVRNSSDCVINGYTFYIFKIFLTLFVLYFN